MANLALVTFGSAGDVHPMLALGRSLRDAGHRVLLLTNPVFATASKDAGIELMPIGESDDYHRAVAHARLWHPVDGLGVMWRYLLRPALQPTYDALAQLYRNAEWRVLATPLAMGARVANEALNLPLISVYTAATLLRSVHNPMTLARWRVPACTPLRLRSWVWRQLDRYKLEPLVRPALDALRARAGLSPLTTSVFGHWMHSPAAGVALFPAWFAPRPADWPAQVVHAGFPLYDDGDACALPADVDGFLKAGTAPVVFMPGTAATGDDSQRFYQAAVKACATSQRRGLLLGRVDADLAASLPASMMASPYAPFASLLPRSAALVHHGGIGSCAQALRAGIPQLLLPQAYDQFDNAMRIETLGVGTALRARSSGLNSMGARLPKLLTSKAVASACVARAAQMSSTDAHRAVARWVEDCA